jgi:hypothetical protein
MKTGWTTTKVHKICNNNSYNNNNNNNNSRHKEVHRPGTTKGEVGNKTSFISV